MENLEEAVKLLKEMKANFLSAWKRCKCGKPKKVDQICYKCELFALSEEALKIETDIPVHFLAMQLANLIDIAQLLTKLPDNIKKEAKQRLQEKSDQYIYRMGQDCKDLYGLEGFDSFETIRLWLEYNYQPSIDQNKEYKEVMAAMKAQFDRCMHLGIESKTLPEFVAFSVGLFEE